MWHAEDLARDCVEYLVKEWLSAFQEFLHFSESFTQWRRRLKNCVHSWEFLQPDCSFYVLATKRRKYLQAAPVSNKSGTERNVSWGTHVQSLGSRIQQHFFTVVHLTGRRGLGSWHIQFHRNKCTVRVHFKRSFPHFSHLSRGGRRKFNTLWRFLVRFQSCTTKGATWVSFFRVCCFKFTDIQKHWSARNVHCKYPQSWSAATGARSKAGQAVKEG